MITIYGKEDCPYCEAAQMLMEARGLEFEYKDMKSDPEVFDEVTKRLGGIPPRLAPQIFDGEVYVGGFDKAKDYF